MQASQREQRTRPVRRLLCLRASSSPWSVLAAWVSLTSPFARKALPSARRPRLVNLSRPLRRARSTASDTRFSADAVSPFLISMASIGVAADRMVNTSGRFRHRQGARHQFADFVQLAGGGLLHGTLVQHLGHAFHVPQRSKQGLGLIEGGGRDSPVLTPAAENPDSQMRRGKIRPALRGLLVAIAAPAGFCALSWALPQVHEKARAFAAPKRSPAGGYRARPRRKILRDGAMGSPGSSDAPPGECRQLRPIANSMALCARPASSSSL